MGRTPSPSPPSRRKRDRAEKRRKRPTSKDRSRERDRERRQRSRDRDRSRERRRSRWKLLSVVYCDFNNTTNLINYYNLYLSNNWINIVLYFHFVVIIRLIWYVLGWEGNLNAKILMGCFIVLGLEVDHGRLAENMNVSERERHVQVGHKIDRNSRKLISKVNHPRRLKWCVRWDSVASTQPKVKKSKVTMSVTFTLS